MVWISEMKGHHEMTEKTEIPRPTYGDFICFTDRRGDQIVGKVTNIGEREYWVETKESFRVSCPFEKAILVSKKM